MNVIDIIMIFALFFQIMLASWHGIRKQNA